MELLYRGFDGLDVSFQGQISPDLCAELEAAKNQAQESHKPVVLFWNGLKLEVSESGARGGYAFTGSTGRFGATWFFKKPNARDLWGIRVSCASFNLALNGLGGARAEVYATLERLGIDLAPGAESLGRVDYAMDFLAPELVLAAKDFVMHSRSGWTERGEPPEIAVHGHSGRVTSVTVGKMPGRQVIVYDKRDEVIAKRKEGWWEIWNAKRARLEEPPLNRHDDPAKSRVWRVELRAGKHHLKERWNIRTWRDLDARFGDMIAASIGAIRHADPTPDSNRSRWPESQLWQSVRDAAFSDLFEMRNWTDPDLVKLVEREAHDQLLAAQMRGSLITRAALRGISAPELAAFARYAGAQMAREIAKAPARFGQKLTAAASRYSLGLDQ